MKKILTLIFTLISILIFSLLSANAMNNDIETAIPVSLNESLNITFETKEEDDAYDQIRWYSFIPNTTGYYKFDINNPYYGDSENDTYICLYDSLSNALYDNYIIYNDMEEDTENISFSVELNKNQKYYICIEVCSCLGVENPHTMTFNITETSQPEGTNAQTAVSVKLEERFEIPFDEETYEYYLKFTPSESGWYEIDLDNFVPDETFVTTYNAVGEEISFDSWDEFTNKCMSCVELTANQVYYIEIHCYSDDVVTVSGTINKHIHDYKLYDIYRADQYEDGYIENECVICEDFEEIPIPKVTISVSQTKFVYNGKKQVPVITITDRTGKSFTEGVDFTIEYPKSSTNADEFYELTVTMENDYYYVYDSISYEISPKSIEELKIKLSKTKVPYGDYPTISISGLKYDEDFWCDMWYWSFGEQKATVYGTGNYTGEKEISFSVVPADITGLKISKTTSSSMTLSWKEDKYFSAQYYQIYDVKKKKVIKTISSDNLSYTIKNLKAGTTYSFKVRGYSKENGEKYYGEWEIITGVTRPASISLTSLKSSKAKTFTAKWDKQTSATGYQIQYSTSSKFSSYKTVKVSKNSSTSKTVSSLKSGKKYYVRIRTYKTVKINGKSKTVYSSWSKAKSITIKK